ncbi:hypothetical protein J5N97_000895 [Dioscorea zingiberensis]|uniref:Uncharacterized protein n=1 Tax=Dioscorea zingiberensis TaxID=325984 RepID=A0A9D5BV50_9LILI|nr:hypothetical protein J5N97_000895 [Dioscorea zingiberensis]
MVSPGLQGSDRLGSKQSRRESKEKPDGGLTPAVNFTREGISDDGATWRESRDVRTGAARVLSLITVGRRTTVSSPTVSGLALCLGICTPRHQLAPT